MPKNGKAGLELTTSITNNYQFQNISIVLDKQSASFTDSRTQEPTRFDKINNFINLGSRCHRWNVVIFDQSHHVYRKFRGGHRLEERESDNNLGQSAVRFQLMQVTSSAREKSPVNHKVVRERNVNTSHNLKDQK